MPKSATKTSKYKPHPGLAKEAEDKVKLKSATGKTFDQWVETTRKRAFVGQKDARMWLQKEQGLGMREAWWIASTALTPPGDANYEDSETLVDALYSGPKAAWRGVHERAVDAAIACGSDVIPTSCQTMVPIYRKHVFMELKPLTDGVLVHFSLGESAPAKGRLAKADGRMPGDRLTHEVLLTSEKDVDAEFKSWVAQAYENGAGKMKRAASAKTPADLAKALKASAKATATWESCTDAMRRDFVQWIESAKQAETRARRIGQSVEKLAAGKKKMY
jgi:hypothetical protein